MQIHLSEGASVEQRELEVVLTVRLRSYHEALELAEAFRQQIGDGSVNVVLMNTKKQET